MVVSENRGAPKSSVLVQDDAKFMASPEPPHSKACAAAMASFIPGESSAMEKRREQHQELGKVWKSAEVTKKKWVIQENWELQDVQMIWKKAIGEH